MNAQTEYEPGLMELCNRLGMSEHRLYHQPLFGKGAHAPPPKAWQILLLVLLVLANQITAGRFFVGHKSVHKLSRQIIVNKMADDVALMALGHERI